MARQYPRETGRPGPRSVVRDPMVPVRAPWPVVRAQLADNRGPLIPAQLALRAQLAAPGGPWPVVRGAWSRARAQLAAGRGPWCPARGPGVESRHAFSRYLAEVSTHPGKRPPVLADESLGPILHKQLPTELFWGMVPRETTPFVCKIDRPKNFCKIQNL